MTSTTFKRTIECVTKSGIVHYNYEIDGKTEPVVIEYHVFVNPRLINMTGWTIEDKLDKKSKISGKCRSYCLYWQKWNLTWESG